MATGNDSVLRRARIEVLPDTKNFDGELTRQLRRTDPGGRAGKQIGGQLNAALRRLDLAPIDIKGNPTAALAAINQTERKLRDLSGEAATVEVKVRTEQAASQLARFRKQLGDMGADAGPEAATGFVARFGARVGPLLANLPLSPHLAIAAGAAAVAVAPIIGATLSAAVIGGAGIGGVAGGLALAAKDPRVQAAAKDLGDRVQERLMQAGSVFVQPALNGLRQIEGALNAIDIEGILRDASRYVPQLTEGIATSMRELGEGVEALVRNAGPVVAVISKDVASLSRTVSLGLQQMAENGPEAADALHAVFEAVGFAVRSTFNLINALTQLYGLWQKINGDPAFKLLMKALGVEMDNTAASGRRLADGTFGVSKSMDAAAGSARGELSAMTALSTELRAQTDPAFALLQAQDKLKAAQDRAAEATRKHGRSSVEARQATRDLAIAALDMQAKAGALGGTFNGKLTPSMIATYRAAGLTESQINDVERELIQARGAADNYAGQYRANVTLTGAAGVKDSLADLLIQQQALKKGISVSAARAAFNKNAFARGGAVRGPGTRTSDSIPALLSNNEHVWTADEVDAVGGHGAMKRMRQAAVAGELPAFARGGAVWPFPTTAAMTRIPSKAEALAAVTPAVPSGGRTGPWIERVAKMLVPGIRVISGYRPGARTLSGNQSLHALDRARDFNASKELARKWDERYGPRTTEAITPWQQYNRLHGRRHRYTGAVWNQHNFAGGNAHDHIAMDDGGARMLQPGLNVVPNWTGRPEPIYGPSAPIHVHLPNAVITSERQAVDLVVKAYKTAKAERRIP